MARLAQVRYSLLVPLILIFVLLGAFSVNRDPLDLLTVVSFGVLGYFMWRLGYPRPAMILGFVLGELFERYLYRSVASYGFTWLQRPSVIVLLVLALGTLFLTLRGRRETGSKAISVAAGPRLKIMFRPKSLLTIFFLFGFLVALISGWGWPLIAKLVPVFGVAIPGALLTLAQLYREVTAPEQPIPETGAAQQADESFETKLDSRTEIWRTLGFFGWFAGGAVAIWLLGIVVTLPLFVLLYTTLEGWEKWRVSLVMSAIVLLLIWGFFEYLMDARWPTGLLFG